MGPLHVPFMEPVSWWGGCGWRWDGWAQQVMSRSGHHRPQPGTSQQPRCRCSWLRPGGGALYITICRSYKCGAQVNSISDLEASQDPLVHSPSIFFASVGRLGGDRYSKNRLVEEIHSLARELKYNSKQFLVEIYDGQASQLGSTFRIGRDHSAVAVI